MADSMAKMARVAADILQYRYLSGLWGAHKLDLSITLGTGLGGLADYMKKTDPRHVVVPYEEIPYFERPLNPKHKGELVLGMIGGKCVTVWNGRFHAYDHEPARLDLVTFPTYVAMELGARVIITTQAAGGLGQFAHESAVLPYKDHFSFVSGVTPLAVPHDPASGDRFVSCSGVYSEVLVEALRRAQQRLPKRLRIKSKILPSGTVAMVRGPVVENGFEASYLSSMGCDGVGMSVFPEAVAAAQNGFRNFAAFAVLTDPAGEVGFSDDAVAQAGKRMSKWLVPLFVEFITDLRESDLRK